MYTDCWLDHAKTRNRRLGTGAPGGQDAWPCALFPARGLPGSHHRWDHPVLYLNLCCIPAPQLRLQGVHGDHADQPQFTGQATESQVTLPSKQTLGRGEGNLGQAGQKLAPQEATRSTQHPWLPLWVEADRPSTFRLPPPARGLPLTYHWLQLCLRNISPGRRRSWSKKQWHWLMFTQPPSCRKSPGGQRQPAGTGGEWELCLGSWATQPPNPSPHADGQPVAQRHSKASLAWPGTPQACGSRTRHGNPTPMAASQAPPPSVGLKNRQGSKMMLRVGLPPSTQAGLGIRTDLPVSSPGENGLDWGPLVGAERERERKCF